jgi:hypothetical protein
MKKLFSRILLAVGLLVSLRGVYAQNAPISAGGPPTVISPNGLTNGDLAIKGPDPFVDVTRFGIYGDLKYSRNVNVSGTTVTIAGGSVNFAASDCQSGSGCTGSVNKVIGFNGGGPSGTITVAAPTPGSGGNIPNNINIRYQFTEIIDNGTLPSGIGEQVNGWTLPTTEATVAMSTNSSLAFPAASANVTNATGIRYYVTGPNSAAANSGEEVLQTPGTIAFGTELTAGTGCTNLESVTIGAPSQAGGVNAQAHALCPAGALTAVIIDNAGSGYTSTPSCALSAGTGTCSVSVGLLCSSQSAANFRDQACDIGSTATMKSVSMVGPLVPVIAGWRSVVNAFTSTTQASIADSIPNNLSGGANFSAWGTENTAAWNSNVLTYSNCTPPNPPPVGNPGCEVRFPSGGSNNAPTGRYLFLNGLPLTLNGMHVSAAGGRGELPNGGAANNWNGPRPSVTIDSLGDTWGIVIGSPTAGVTGVTTTNLAAQDTLGGLGWGGYYMGGPLNSPTDHLEIDKPTAYGFSYGYGMFLTQLQSATIIAPQLAPCAVCFRMPDNVSAVAIFGGAVSGNLATTGLGWGTWISNSPLATLQEYGNIVFNETAFRDFYQGDKRITDSTQNKFIGTKTENIALSGGASCGGTTACYGVNLLTEGNVSGRCNNNQDISTTAAKNVNYVSEVAVAGGVACTSTDVYFDNITAFSGSFCVQTPCNANDSTLDVYLGNSGHGLLASELAGGTAFGPDVLSGASPAIDCSNGNFHYYRPIGGTITPTLTNAKCQDGQEITVEVCQDGTGNRQWTWPTAFKGASNINPAPSSCTTQTFHWDATNSFARRDGEALYTLNVTNATATTAATNIITGNANKIAQQYVLSGEAHQAATACVGTTGSLVVVYGWTDSSGTARTASNTLTFTTTQSATAGFLNIPPVNIFPSTGTNVQVTATYTACGTSGPNYDLHVTALPVQFQ